MLHGWRGRARAVDRVLEHIAAVVSPSLRQSLVLASLDQLLLELSYLDVEGCDGCLGLRELALAGAYVGEIGIACLELTEQVNVRLLELGGLGVHRLRLHGARFRLGLSQLESALERRNGTSSRRGFSDLFAKRSRMPLALLLEGMLVFLLARRQSRRQLRLEPSMRTGKRATVAFIRGGQRSCVLVSRCREFTRMGFRLSTKRYFVLVLALRQQRVVLRRPASKSSGMRSCLRLKSTLQRRTVFRVARRLRGFERLPVGYRTLLVDLPSFRQRCEVLLALLLERTSERHGMLSVHLGSQCRMLLLLLSQRRGVLLLCIV